MKELSYRLAQQTKKGFSDLEKTFDEGFIYADPRRIEDLFKDVEFYKRGKLAGQDLEQYLELLAVFQTGSGLSSEQGIQLSMLLSKAFNPVFKTDGIKERAL